MTLSEIANIRLISQQISGTKFKTVKEIVGWMGVMQAQDYAMSKWAVGARLPDSTDALIQKAVDNGEIIRTHILRPTWHLVSADDIWWMLELSAPQIKILMKSWNKALELDSTVFTKCNRLIENALSGGKHLIREDLTKILEKAKIATGNNRSSHILMNAELDGIICSGPLKNNKQTYALLPERVSKTNSLSREEALGNLGRKYFESHGPATLKDFIWWSGLPVKDAKYALEMIKSEIISEIIGPDQYWFSNSFSLHKNDLSFVKLLPAFDEYLISYKDRIASLTLENQKKAFTRNGIFRPVFLVDGKVTGLWKKTIKKDKVIVETDFFKPHNKSVKYLIGKEIEKFGQFLDKKIEIIYDRK